MRMMKILLVHNYYGSSAPSGENTAYRAEADLLRRYGYDVHEFTRSSDGIRSQGILGIIKGALAVAWNPFAARALRLLLQKVKPDVVHVHNVFPLLSPSIFYAVKAARVPVVLTLHNYRIACSAGTAVRGDRSCTLCLDKRSVLPALRYGCYRKSRAATLPVALMIALHRRLRTWDRCIDAFIVLTEYHRDTIAGYGIPGERIAVKPHFMSLQMKPVPWDSREEKVVFVGRLYEAKGIHVLLRAWMRWGEAAPALQIIGDGPLMSQLAAIALPLQGNVSLTGNISRDETLRLMARAKLLVIPSLCLEGFPMVVQEAFALGVPVAASRIGSLQTLVTENQTGILFAPGDESDMLEQIRKIWEKPEILQRCGAAAQKESVEKYSAQKNHELLSTIYQAAVDHAQPNAAK